jgi:hyperosmotically inducible periplasmic protein
MLKAIMNVALVSCLGLIGCKSDSARERDESPASKPVEVESKKAPDNTDVNERDRGGGTLTPMDQSNSEVDLKITQELRQQIVADDSLSFDAKNVKIITSGAVITLRGPVKSEAERTSIEARARKVAGVASVNNELEVAADK